MDVGEDFRAWTNCLFVSKRVEGVAFDEALVRKHCAGMDINANEAAATCGAEPQGRACIVTEDIEPERQLNGSLDCAPRRGHCSNCGGTNSSFCEWHVAKILNDERVSATALVGARIVDGELDNFLQIAAPTRRAGKRTEMDDADEEFAPGLKKGSHGLMTKFRHFFSASFCSRSFVSAANAASLSAAFLLLPWPRASSTPAW